MDPSYAAFAAQAGVRAADRALAADPAHDMDRAEASVVEFISWWGIVGDQLEGVGTPWDVELGHALSFARHCSMHARIVTHEAAGSSWPRDWPRRRTRRLVWRSTVEVEVGARHLTQQRTQRERAAYDRLLSRREIPPVVEMSRVVLGLVA